MKNLVVDTEYYALSKAFGVNEFGKLLEDNMGRESKEITKTSFAPSSLGYSGACFAAETEFYASDGIMTMEEAYGKEINVFTGYMNMSAKLYPFSKKGGWKPATVENFGKQKLYRLTLIKRGITKKIYCTGNHRWITETTYRVENFPHIIKKAAWPKITTELEPGDKLYVSVPTRKGVIFLTEEEEILFRFNNWVVVSVEETDRFEDVYCVVEPVTERFTLVDGILTMNCPRYWNYAFNGAMFEYESEPTAISNMDAGTDSGERIAKLVDKAGILIDAEIPARNEDPPVFGYIDLMVNWKGEEVPAEVKTTKAETFNTRLSSNSVPGYQLLQLLIYMYIKKKDKGFFITENKNTHELFILPVKMTEENRNFVERVFDWMREVKANADTNTLPTRSFVKSSIQCKGCAVKKTCWETKEDLGEVTIPKLEIPK